ncbi:MAG: ATPase domain-containing protein [Nitrosopumilaceae archaeon]|nr:ATPase domain-containing protein [Nitrosopumilaceae archaeon]
MKNSKVRTGIPGFDMLISGGLREGKSIVISGSPGSGKTTFGMQFVYNGAMDFEEPGIYVTMVQSPYELINDFKEYGWNIEKLIKEDKMLLIDARPFKLSESFDEEGGFATPTLQFTYLNQMIMHGIKKINAKRLAIDSLSSFTMQYANQFEIRQGIQHLIQNLEEQNCTSILISENLENRTPPEWYAASGIILLNYDQKINSMERTIQVLKMRGIKHSEQAYPIRFTENGYQVIHPRVSFV